MRLIHCFLGLLIVFQTLSQNTLSISGKVVDQETEELLPFATVGVKGSPYGTITNADGAFTFFLPASYLNDTLSVSYVGFETYKVVINKVTEGHLAVALREQVVVLEQVEVNVEQLTGKQIIQRALDKLKENYSNKPCVLKGFFRDIREQNGETVYLEDAVVDVQDIGVSMPRKFFLKGVRASNSRIHTLLSEYFLTTRNFLSLNVGHNYWINYLKHNVRKKEFIIADIITKNDNAFYVITTTETISKEVLAEEYKDLSYTLTHRYLVNCETFAIHKIEHLEDPTKGKYTGIEPPYEGDTLFHSKKGWNLVIEFEEYQGKMYLKYHDASYAFDIVDKKNDRIFLEMKYQFVFMVTDIETDTSKKPSGEKMNRNRPLSLQTEGYDRGFWEDLDNARLMPLTQKQIKDLEKYQPLEAQFQSNKTQHKKNVDQDL